ncbi:MAG: S8 family peptidase [Rubrobacteraceae bacterium]
MARVFNSAVNTRHVSVLIVALFGALVSLLLVAQGAWGIPEEEIDQEAGNVSYVAGELLVVYKTDISGAVAEEVPDESGGEVTEDIPEIDAQLIEFPGVKDEPTERQREKLLNRKKEQLEQEPEVESVSLNYIYQGSFTPNDPEFGDQYGLNKIRATKAWDETLGKGVDIAVVDTGIDVRHPDLAKKVVKQRNFVGPTETNSARDDNGHGTAVAGVAAAITNNREGVAGACPRCRLVVAKSLKANNSGTAKDVAEGITWAANNGAEVINLSLGAVGADSAVLKEAVNYATSKDIVVVAAAGNQGINRPSYPAAYENVISVAATNRNDRRASFSNYGRTIDVAAPGVDILTTDRRSRAGFSRGNYTVIDGTSFSSPFTAGVAGLLASQGRSRTEIRARIERTARDVGQSGRDNLYGHGIVNAAAAVGSRTKSPPNTAPKISNPRPIPGSTVKGRKPNISATVRDAETNLRKKNVTLLLDGKKKTAFKYDTTRDRLTYKPAGKLAPGKHTAKVIVGDGRSKKATRKWSFKVKGQETGVEGLLSMLNEPGYPFNIIPKNPIFEKVRN